MKFIALLLILASSTLELLLADSINDRFKAALRQAAEQKIARLKGSF